MIVLDSGHQIIKDAITSRLGPSKAEIRSKGMTLVVSDFDDATYCLTSQGDTLTVFVRVNAFESLKKLGVEEYLRKVYSDDHFVLDFNSSTQQQMTYDFSLSLNLAPDFGEKAESIVDQVSCIKRNVLAGPFMWYFNAMKNGSAPEDAVKIPFRANEAMYVKKGKDDTAVVIFSVSFPEKTDWFSSPEKFQHEYYHALFIIGKLDSISLP